MKSENAAKPTQRGVASGITRGFDTARPAANLSPMKCFLLIQTALLLATVTQAKTLVVNPALTGAGDSNPGTETQPLRTIRRAAELVQPGDVVTIHSSVYRESVAIKQSGTREQPIRFEAAPNAQVVITGADLLTGWIKDKDSDHSYSIDWPHQLFQGDDHNPRGTEQVFVNRQLYLKVPSLAALTNGTFFVDLAAKRLHLFATRNPDEDQTMQPIEGSTRAAIWTVSGSDVQTRGFCFRYSASRAQQGMAQFKGARDVVEDCVFEWSNSTGATFTAPDVTVRRCVFQDNGQQGFSGSHNDRLRLDGCTVQRNNNKEFPRGWEAGGNKMCMSRGVIYENCRFLNNHGSGVWFDISNVDATIRNCLIADNEDAGIFYEISYGLHAHDNVIAGNGRRPSPGSWGANGGVCISSSPGCVIERNLIIGNEQGFCFREQDRTTPRIDGTQGPEIAIWNHDEVVRNNLLVNNHNAEVQGWFDIGTERHWPRAMQTGRGNATKARADMAAGYQAQTDGVPPGLSLEDLKITFQNNIYAHASNQPFFIWGVNWKPKKEFRDIPTLARTLGFEGQASQMLSALPVNAAKRDFRLPEALHKAVQQAYPRGRVPDCALNE
jgi:hypothetical protein